MHINSDWTILEVVDELNQPVPDGVIGSRVLVTNLANFTQPFLRYIVEDRIAVRRSPECECGSRFPWIEQIEGRASELIWVTTEDGQEKFLSGVLFHSVFDKFQGIREWRVLQSTSTSLLI